MKEIGRRKFFSRISMGAIGTLLLSFNPLNVFGKTNKHNFGKVIVKIHPNSVKRNKKVSK